MKSDQVPLQGAEPALFRTGCSQCDTRSGEQQLDELRLTSSGPHRPRLSLWPDQRREDRVRRTPPGQRALRQGGPKKVVRGSPSDDHRRSPGPGHRPDTEDLGAQVLRLARPGPFDQLNSTRVAYQGYPPHPRHLQHGGHLHLVFSGA